MSVVSVAACETYEAEAVRQAVTAVLEPLGGMGRFVRPGMRVLLKPNLLTGVSLERAVTTHPAVVQAVAELVQEAGGEALIGDSPGGPIKNNPQTQRKSGMVDVAERSGARLLTFDGVVWKRLNGSDYFIARPVLEADLVINLPKLKTHSFTLFTGAVKNLFGVIPGNRKREVHVQAPGVKDFSRVLVDVLDLVRPGLTLMDGVLGQEGNGPGPGGTARQYGCLLASTDPVALDTVVTDAMSFRPGEVLHLAQAGARRLGAAGVETVQVLGQRRALDFGALDLPRARWYLNVPAWMGTTLSRAIKVRPQLEAAACTGCGRCVEACPRETIAAGKPTVIDLGRCIGCFCCAEVCAEGAIAARRNWGARLFGLGG